MDLFHFDIRTVTKYPDYKTFKDNDTIGSLLFEKKYENSDIFNKNYTIEDFYVNKASTIPTFGKIVCISFGFNDEKGDKILSYYGDDEKDIITKFNSILKKVENKNFKLTGFGINNFDIPYLFHKMIKYDIVPADIINFVDKKPWESRIIDMFEVWKHKYFTPFSFEEMCYELNLLDHNNLLYSENTNRYYWIDKNIDKIVEDCENTIKLSIKCGLKLFKRI